MNQDQRLQRVLTRAVEGSVLAPVVMRKRIALYCSTGSRVRKPGAPAAGNRIGDLVPAAQACLGMLRMYAATDTIASLPALQEILQARRGGALVRQ